MVHSSDAEDLFRYFQGLSPQTRKRFGPHPFDSDTCKQIASNNYLNYKSFIARNQTEIAAYLVIRQGYIQGDHERYGQYAVDMDEHSDFTLAPSVSDGFQSKGIGSQLFLFVQREIADLGGRRIVLWGGVQESNQIALSFYKKFGFEVVGNFFDHNGNNFDMTKDLTSKNH